MKNSNSIEMLDRSASTATAARRPTVFVTQIPVRFDKDTGSYAPAFNIAPASEHGTIEVLFPEQANFFATADLIKQLRKRLMDYDYEAGDCLLATGDPAITAAACAILGRESRDFIILRWDKQIYRYVQIHIHI